MPHQPEVQKVNQQVVAPAAIAVVARRVSPPADSSLRLLFYNHYAFGLEEKRKMGFGV